MNFIGIIVYFVLYAVLGLISTAIARGIFDMPITYWDGIVFTGIILFLSAIVNSLLEIEVGDRDE
jgi:hypothetical protein